MLQSGPRAAVACSVLTRDGNKAEVEYDNGERERVLAENVSPQDVPVAFGAEQEPLQVPPQVLLNPAGARSSGRGYDPLEIGEAGLCVNTLHGSCTVFDLRACPTGSVSRGVCTWVT